MSQSLTARTFRGLKWSYASTISTALLQIVYTAVMARLLNPADFGLVAMSGVVLRFGSYFAQMGMSSALIQKKNLSEENVNAAFTSSVFLGITFSTLIILFAPLAKYVFDNESIVLIVRVMALSLLINGFSLTAIALLRREMRFKSLAVAEILSFLFGYLIFGIGTASLGAGVWSLVIAALVSSFILAIYTFLMIRHKIKFSFAWENYKPLISFGGKVSIISFLEFIGGSLDTLLIGRYFGASPLGIYNRAQMLINLPMQYFTSSFSKVLFPSFSEIQKDDEKLKKTMLFILQIVSLILFPFAIFVAVLSKEIVLIILGEQWLEAGPLLKILSFAAAFNLLTHFIAILFEAKGYLRIKIIIETVFILTLAIALYISLPYGLYIFTFTLFIFYFLKSIQYLFYFIKRFNVKIREIIQCLFPSILSSIVFLILLIPFYHALNLYVNNFMLVFIISFIITIALYTGVLFLMNKEIISKVLNMWKKFKNSLNS